MGRFDTEKLGRKKEKFEFSHSSHQFCALGWNSLLSLLRFVAVVVASTQLSRVKVFLGWRVQVNNRDHGDQGKLGDQGCQVLLVDQGGEGVLHQSAT